MLPGLSADEPIEKHVPPNYDIHKSEKQRSRAASSKKNQNRQQSKPMFPYSAVYKSCSFETTYNLIYEVKILPKPLPHLIENKEDLKPPS